VDENLPSTLLVIFGVSGDLSKRYLLPAMAEICASSDIRAHLKLLGVSRRPLAVEEILTDTTRRIASQLSTIQLDYTQPQEYQKLKDYLKEHPAEQVIFYFAVPPDAAPDIIKHLGAAGLNHDGAKLLLEKPFGTDLASAKELINQTSKYFSEDQVYRIDHYLAKTVAQNISVFLSSNALFRNVWSKDFIEYIEIVVAEKIGLENRVAFYEKTGALRDIVQSHLLQLAALTLMEASPDPFDVGDVPARRLAALKNLELAPDLTSSVYRAQFESYKHEVGNPDSQVETFVALQLASKDERWKGVPIYLATGKNLDRRLTQIRVNFKKSTAAQANTLILRIQPDEGIELDLWIRKPGYQRQLQEQKLSYSFAQSDSRLPDAYEQVLVEAIRSDHSLFTGSGEVLESWRIIQPVLDHWHKGKVPLPLYKPGTPIEQILKNT
jgi:glucose-6-phosphate 1-dehydrogenase